MNERIQELAEQAGMVMYPTGLGGIKENTIWGDHNIEKFAELIVRECANIADKAEPYKSTDLILKHFGVEE